MNAEILLCDIGNTAVKAGFADRRAILSSFVFPAKNAETADSFGLKLLEAARFAGYNPDNIKACVVSSVAPALNGVAAGAASRYFRCPCLFAPEDLPAPLEIDYARPAEVGADRLMAAFAARRIFPDRESLIVVDYGTAATFDCVSGMAYKGGLIFPGPQTAVMALARNTAKLPAVDLSAPLDGLEIGSDTATSVRCGVLFGYASLTEGLVALLAGQLPSMPLTILTGGMARILSGLSRMEHIVVPDLPLEGLRSLYCEYY
ncbi:MAG: type III pantothenate kinase [Desulfovibrio sp.]|nr:type III pantothenate kinase [Desulfovibrio sp.]